MNMVWAMAYNARFGRYPHSADDLLRLFTVRPASYVTKKNKDYVKRKISLMFRFQGEEQAKRDIPDLVSGTRDREMMRYLCSKAPNNAINNIINVECNRRRSVALKERSAKSRPQMGNTSSEKLREQIFWANI